jgi:hypothetical protein
MKREVIAGTSIDAEPHPVTAWIELPWRPVPLWSRLRSHSRQPGVPGSLRVLLIVAGIYGTVTATRRILSVQVIPGALALLLVLLT